jgi:gamma-glutamyltranspeptidase/glutathione hydrolase/leukotriene-C4 hydrolase
MFNGKPESSRVGGLAVGVPGELRGLQAAYNAWGGGISWERLFEPSIKLAKEGWAASKELERRLDVGVLPVEARIRVTADGNDKLFGHWMVEKPEWKAVFAPNGTLVRAGDWISRPTYGETLRRVATEGVDAFYTVGLSCPESNSYQC